MYYIDNSTYLYSTNNREALDAPLNQLFLVIRNKKILRIKVNEKRL